MSGSDRLKKAKSKAGRYCAYGERSPRQVREKLISYGLSNKEAEVVLSQLIKESFVDEFRFARAFSNDKFKFNRWGKLKIRLELKRKHRLGDEAIQNGLDYIEDVEYVEMIGDLLRKKWSKLPDSIPYLDRKKRTVDFLIRKGFEQELVYRQLNDYLSTRQH